MLLVKLKLLPSGEAVCLKFELTTPSTLNDEIDVLSFCLIKNTTSLSLSVGLFNTFSKHMTLFFTQPFWAFIFFLSFLCRNHNMQSSECGPAYLGTPATWLQKDVQLINEWVPEFKHRGPVDNLRKPEYTQIYLHTCLYNYTGISLFISYYVLVNMRIDSVWMFRVVQQQHRVESLVQ